MDYTNPHIERKNVKGKGNGTISTKNFVASELIMVAKALVFAQFDPHEVTGALGANSTQNTIGASTKMLPHLVEELILHPSCGSELYSLSAGSKYPNPVLPENSSKVDILRMSAILASNWFGADANQIRKSIDSQRKSGTEGIPNDGLSKAGTGLWLRPSIFNHSCMPNCTYFVIGDFHFIITSHPVAIGEELTIAYCDIRLSFIDRCKIFKKWNDGDGFDCLCERCSYSRQNPAIVAIDVEIDKAYLTADQLCMQGYPIGQAVNKALPISRRKTIINILEKLPLISQGSLSKVYELESSSHAHAGSYLEGLSIARKSVEAKVNFFGIGPEFLDILEAYLKVVNFAIGLHEMDLARSTLMTVYTIFCSPPWGKYTKDDLKILCQGYLSTDQHSVVNHMIDDLEWK